MFTLWAIGEITNKYKKKTEKNWKNWFLTVNTKGGKQDSVNNWRVLFFSSKGCSYLGILVCRGALISRCYCSYQRLFLFPFSSVFCLYLSSTVLLFTKRKSDSSCLIWVDDLREVRAMTSLPHRVWMRICIQHLIRDRLRCRPWQFNSKVLPAAQE